MRGTLSNPWDDNAAQNIFAPNLITLFPDTTLHAQISYKFYNLPPFIYLIGCLASCQSNVIHVLTTLCFTVLGWEVQVGIFIFLLLCGMCWLNYQFSLLMNSGICYDTSD